MFLLPCGCYHPQDKFGEDDNILAEKDLTPLVPLSTLVERGRSKIRRTGGEVKVVSGTSPDARIVSGLGPDTTLNLSQQIERIKRISITEISLIGLISCEVLPLYLCSLWMLSQTGRHPPEGSWRAIVGQEPCAPDNNLWTLSQTDLRHPQEGS